MADYKRTTKEKVDDFYYEIRNKLNYSKYFYEKTIKGKHKQLKKNINLKNRYKNKRCFVIGNSPSINNQNLKLLKNDIVFMVNRAFLHPDYNIIKPKYHVIVDPKLATGEWSITFLDKIAKKNPNVTFLLNADWFDLPLFEPYKKKYKIYWIDQSLIFTPNIKNRKIDLTKRTYSMYVVEQAITTAIYMGCKEIYFTGVEGNGWMYHFNNKQTHFYGSNKEDLKPDWLKLSRSFNSGSYWLKVWNNIAHFCKIKNITLINLTAGGIMDMVKRKDFNKIINKKNNTQ